ncbi:MAG: hypothetical protein Ct9H300mP19_05050 [Dehalococcoidia bacterium]|nr:MAG: hypothetical protein Ct9H300mP19_05050 [Dehalococcoidia bacterium]
MTVNDFWVLSPEIAMALLALVVITADLITRNVVKVLFITLVGSQAAGSCLNLWSDGLATLSRVQPCSEQLKPTVFTLFQIPAYNR